MPIGQPSAIGHRAGSELATHYTWSFPGSRPIRLALSFVERLQHQLDTADRSGARQAVLLGRAVGNATVIDDYVTIPGKALPSGNDIAALLARSGGSDAVGYFRIHHDAVLRLNNEDLALAQRVFSRPHQVFLLVHPEDSGPATATFFFWDNGKMWGDLPFLEFPFDHALLAAEQRQRLRRTPEESLSNAGESDPHSPRLRRSHKIIIAVVIATSLGAMVAARLQRRFWTGRSPSSSPSVSGTIPARALLGLHADRRSGGLELTWDRQSPAVISATSGGIAIKDGHSSRQIVLDPVQVRTGKVLYAPSSDQIQIQLTVSGPRGPASETAIVVLPTTFAPRIPNVSRDAGPNQRPASPRVTEHGPDKPFPSQSASPYTQTPPPVITVRDLPAHPAPSLVFPTPPPPPAYSPPEVVKSVNPVYPRELRGVDPQSKMIEIKVFIDEMGRVVRAEPLPPKAWVSQSIVKACLEAVRFWKFKPARWGAQDVPGEMLLQFEFKSAGN